MRSPRACSFDFMNMISLQNDWDAVEHSCPQYAFAKDTCPGRISAKDTCAGHAFAQHTEKCASEQDDFCYIFPRLTQLESVPYFRPDRSPPPLRLLSVCSSRRPRRRGRRRERNNLKWFSINASLTRETSSRPCWRSSIINSSSVISSLRMFLRNMRPFRINGSGGGSIRRL